MKLVVSVPSNGLMQSETTLCLINALYITKLEGIWTIFPRSCFVHQGRNDAVEEAIGSDFSHILFVDSDMWFQPDSVLSLASRHKDIVGAAYNKRGVLPRESTVRWNGTGSFPPNPFIVNGLGFGLILIKLDVFRKISKPWFWYTLGEGNNFTGEDYYFCEKARQSGYKIWCDPTLKVEHIGTYHY